MVGDADFDDAWSMPCPDTAVNPTILARVRPLVGVQYDAPDGSYRHLLELGITGVPDRLAADLEVVDEAMRACAASSPTAEGVTVRAISLPALGDQRAGWAMTAEQRDGAEAVTWQVRSATVRRGSVAVRIGLTEILDRPSTPPSITDEAFVAIVRTAVATIGS